MVWIPPETDPEVRTECWKIVYLGGTRNSKNETGKGSQSIKGGLYWLPL